MNQVFVNFRVTGVTGVNIYIYIYIYIERERESIRENGGIQS